MKSILTLSLIAFFHDAATSQRLSNKINLNNMTSAARHNSTEDRPVNALYYRNEYLYETVTPSFYPSLTPNQINIISPLTFDLSSIRFSGLQLNPLNISTPNVISLGGYNTYAKLTGGNPDLIRANHNMIISETQEKILDKTIEFGCNVTAKISVIYLQLWLGKACAAAPESVVACALSLALADAEKKKSTEVVINEGCKVTVRYASKKIWEITIETYRDLKNSIEEAKAWLAFMNSIEGMVWLRARFERGGP